MILEIRILGLRLVLAPKTVEALLAFIAAVLDGSGRDEEKSASIKTLE